MKIERKKWERQTWVYLGTLVGVVLLSILLCRGMYQIIQNSFYEMGVKHEVDSMTIMQTMGSELVDIKLRDLKESAEKKTKAYAFQLYSRTQEKRQRLLADIELEEDRLGYCYYSDKKLIYGNPKLQNTYVESLDLDSILSSGETKIFDADFDEAENFIMAVAAR